jgi:hypothetical protein
VYPRRLHSLVNDHGQDLESVLERVSLVIVVVASIPGDLELRTQTIHGSCSCCELNALKRVGLAGGRAVRASCRSVNAHCMH